MLDILNYSLDTEEGIFLYKDSVLFVVLGNHGSYSIPESFPIDVPQK
jgi:hypothetical protein